MVESMLLLQLFSVNTIKNIFSFNITKHYFTVTTFFSGEAYLATDHTEKISSFMQYF